MPVAAMRETLERGEMVVAPGAYDAITARLIRHLGFKALYIPGSQTGMVLGTTEPLTSLTEMAMVGERVSEGVNDELPVILDAGAGFGDPVHVVHTVEVLEDAGLTAIHVEDQFFPKRVSYHRGLEHVVPVDVYQQRIQYAVNARRSKDFLIIARNDGYRAVEGGTRQHAVERAHAAQEVGADIVMIMGMREKEDFEYFRREIKDIPMLAMAGFGPFGVNEYRDMGYQVIIYPQTTIQTSLRSVHDLWKNVKDTGSVPDTFQPQSDKMREVMNVLLEFEEKWAVEAATTEKDSAPRAH